MRTMLLLSLACYCWLWLCNNDAALDGTVLKSLRLCLLKTGSSDRQERPVYP
jgi:hypothetical protein